MEFLFNTSELHICVTIVKSDKLPLYQVYELSEVRDAEEWIQSTLEGIKKEQLKYDGVQLLNYISADFIKFSEFGDHSILEGRKFHIVEHLYYFNGDKI